LTISAFGGYFVPYLIRPDTLTSVRSQIKEAEVLARASKKRKVNVKQIKHRNDPLVHLYDVTQDWLQDRGRPLVIVVGVIVGVALLYVAGSTFFSWRESRAARAFAEAYEKYNAPVQDSTSLTTTPVLGKSYTDEKVKWQETAEAFEKLANDYPGYYDNLGRYYAGAAYLHFDPAKGTQLLEQVAGKNDPETSDLARLALAEHYAINGENDKAIEIFDKLASSSPNLKQASQLRLAQLYEKTDQTERAVELYFEVAKADRATPAGSEAEKRLSAIAPDRIKDLPPVDPMATAVP